MHSLQKALEDTWRTSKSRNRVVRYEDHCTILRITKMHKYPVTTNTRCSSKKGDLTVVKAPPVSKCIDAVQNCLFGKYVHDLLTNLVMSLLDY